MRLPFALGEGGRYEVSQLVATGGTSEIYLAFDQVDRAWRAVKMLRPEVRMRTDARRRLKAEADALSRLDHPHVLRVYDRAIRGEEAWIVTDYAERRSVGHHLAEHGAMPLGAALEVARQVCLGLEHAHARGVVHRDIKPYNVLIDGRGACVVCDFGVAALEDHDLTTTGTTLGTLGYMAPEQIGGARDVDGRADVYSVGATLYHLVVGREPRDLYFTGPSDPALLAAPDGVRQLVVGATRRAREDRFATVGAMRAVIESLLRVHPKPDALAFPLLATPPGAAPDAGARPVLFDLDADVTLVPITDTGEDD